MVTPTNFAASFNRFFTFFKTAKILNYKGFLTFSTSKPRSIFRITRSGRLFVLPKELSCKTAALYSEIGSPTGLTYLPIKPASFGRDTLVFMVGMMPTSDSLVSQES